MATALCETMQSRSVRYQWPSTSDAPSRPAILRLVSAEPSQTSIGTTSRTKGVRSPSATPFPSASNDPEPSVNATPEPKPATDPSKASLRFTTARPDHTRARSATAVQTAFPKDIHRMRTSSSAGSVRSLPGRGRTTRPRLPSMLSSVLTPTRAPVRPRATTGESEPTGSFTPTHSPRLSLRHLLAASGSSSPHRRLITDLTYISTDDVPHPTSPASPIPSICRTPSSYDSSEYFPTAPSSAGPATPRDATPPPARKAESAGVVGMNPVLERLERKSMFCVAAACVTCGARGSNFPCCPRCGEMWCSRECRLQRGDGKRHICRRKNA